jgi:DNA-binding MarR family transcriptional regulator
MSPEPDLTQDAFEAAARRRLLPLESTLDLDSFQAVWLIHQAADASRRYLTDNALADVDLSWSQFEVLWHVWIFGDQEPRCIADALQQSKSGITAVTTYLENRGLVRRRGDKLDRRRVHVTVTRKGDALMRRFFPRFNAAEAAFSSRLTLPEKSQLAQLLRTLLSDDSSTERTPPHNGT